MMRTLVILSAVLALIVAVLWTRRPQPQPQSAPDEVKPLPVANVPREWKPLKEPAATSATVVATIATNALTFDSARYGKDAEYMAKVHKHMELRWLESSPAKDTPEMKQIQEMLAARGVGREASPACYNLAYEFTRHLTASEAVGQLEAGRVMAAGETMRGMNDLIQDYKLDSEFFDELFALRPKVFIGRKDMSAPQQGEKLLSE